MTKAELLDDLTAKEPCEFCRILTEQNAITTVCTTYSKGQRIIMGLGGATREQGLAQICYCPACGKGLGCDKNR